MNNVFVNLQNSERKSEEAKCGDRSFSDRWRCWIEAASKRTPYHRGYSNRNSHQDSTPGPEREHSRKDLKKRLTGCPTGREIRPEPAARNNRNYLGFAWSGANDEQDSRTRDPKLDDSDSGKREPRTSSDKSKRKTQSRQKPKQQ